MVYFTAPATARTNTCPYTVCHHSITGDSDNQLRSLILNSICWNTRWRDKLPCCKSFSWALDFNYVFIGIDPPVDSSTLLAPLALERQLMSLSSLNIGATPLFSEHRNNNPRRSREDPCHECGPPRSEACDLSQNMSSFGEGEFRSHRLVGRDEDCDDCSNCRLIWGHSSDYAVNCCETALAWTQENLLLDEHPGEHGFVVAADNPWESNDQQPNAS